MASNRSDTPFLVAYLLVLVCQLPIWLLGGVFWSVFMVLVAGSNPFDALIGGLGWGITMWIIMGNLLAIGLAWRRSANFPVEDRAAFRQVLDQVCRKLRLIVLAESPDEIILGPKWAIIRFRLQQVVVSFTGESATLTASALSFFTIRKQLHKALAATTTCRE